MEEEKKNKMTVLNVSQDTKELFDRTLTRNMSQDEGVKALLDFWTRYKGVVDAPR